MLSFWFRQNALLTLSVTVLGIICASASFSNTFNSPSPTATIQVLNINRFPKLSSGNDEVRLALNVTADFQSLFTWNTKQVFVFIAAEYESSKNTFNQVSLWDAIIPSQEHAKFSIRNSNKYKFIDKGSNLLGREFNLTLHWHVMPKTGSMFDNKIVKTGHRLPQE